MSDGIISHTVAPAQGQLSAAPCVQWVQAKGEKILRSNLNKRFRKALAGRDWPSSYKISKFQQCRFTRFMKQTELYALLWNKNANTRKMASVRSAHYPSTVEEMVDNGHEKTEVSRKSRTSILTIRPAASQGPAKNPYEYTQKSQQNSPISSFQQIDPAVRANPKGCG